MAYYHSRDSYTGVPGPSYGRQAAHRTPSSSRIAFPRAHTNGDSRDAPHRRQMSPSQLALRSYAQNSDYSLSRHSPEKRRDDGPYDHYKTSVRDVNEASRPLRSGISAERKDGKAYRAPSPVPSTDAPGYPKGPSGTGQAVSPGASVGSRARPRADLMSLAGRRGISSSVTPMATAMARASGQGPTGAGARDALSHSHDRRPRPGQGQGQGYAAASSVIGGYGRATSPAVRMPDSSASAMQPSQSRLRTTAEERDRFCHPHPPGNGERPANERHFTRVSPVRAPQHGSINVPTERGELQRDRDYHRDGQRGGGDQSTGTGDLPSTSMMTSMASDRHRNDMKDIGDLDLPPHEAPPRSQPQSPTRDSNMLSNSVSSRARPSDKNEAISLAFPARYTLQHGATTSSMAAVHPRGSPVKPTAPPMPPPSHGREQLTPFEGGPDALRGCGVYGQLQIFGVAVGSLGLVSGFTIEATRYTVELPLEPQTISDASVPVTVFVQAPFMVHPYCTIGVYLSQMQIKDGVSTKEIVSCDRVGTIDLRKPSLSLSVTPKSSARWSIGLDVFGPLPCVAPSYPYPPIYSISAPPSWSDIMNAENFNVFEAYYMLAMEGPSSDPAVTASTALRKVRQLEEICQLQYGEQYVSQLYGILQWVYKVFLTPLVEQGDQASLAVRRRVVQLMAVKPALISPELVQHVVDSLAQGVSRIGGTIMSNSTQSRVSDLGVKLKAAEAMLEEFDVKFRLEMLMACSVYIPRTAAKDLIKGIVDKMNGYFAWLQGNFIDPATGGSEPVSAELRALAKELNARISHMLDSVENSRLWFDTLEYSCLVGEAVS